MQTGVLYMHRETCGPKLTTLSLHSHACGLPISPQCCKGADSILPPGVRLLGLRGSSPPSQPGQPHPWGNARCCQPACGVAVTAASTTELLLLIRAHGWHLLAPPRQDQPGDRRVCADPITASVQPHYRSLPPQGSHPPDGCIAIACEICFVMLFLHYHITD